MCNNCFVIHWLVSFNFIKLIHTISIPDKLYEYFSQARSIFFLDKGVGRTNQVLDFTFSFLAIYLLTLRDFMMIYF